MFGRKKQDNGDSRSSNGNGNNRPNWDGTQGRRTFFDQSTDGYPYEYHGQYVSWSRQGNGDLQGTVNTGSWNQEPVGSEYYDPGFDE